MTRERSIRSAGVGPSLIAMGSSAAESLSVAPSGSSTTLSSLPGAMSIIAATTTMTVAIAPRMFHVEKIVSLTGIVRPTWSSTKVPGVAAASGPEPE